MSKSKRCDKPVPAGYTNCPVCRVPREHNRAHADEVALKTLRDLAQDDETTYGTLRRLMITSEDQIAERDEQIRDLRAQLAGKPPAPVPPMDLLAVGMMGFAGGLLAGDTATAALIRKALGLDGKRDPKPDKPAPGSSCQKTPPVKS